MKLKLGSGVKYQLVESNSYFFICESQIFNLFTNQLTADELKEAYFQVDVATAILD